MKSMLIEFIDGTNIGFIIGKCIGYYRVSEETFNYIKDWFLDKDESTIEVITENKDIILINKNVIKKITIK